MFNFTTQTVFNSVVKATPAQVKSGAKKNANLIVNENAKRGPELRIGNTRFNKANVLDVQIKTHTVEQLANVEFDLSEIAGLVGEDFAGIYRVAFYIGLSMNSQDSLYANPHVFKGKPFYVEFMVNPTESSGTAPATRLAANAKKYMLLQFDEKILNVTVNGAKVKFEATNGYQIIRKAVLQRYDEKAVTVDCCNYSGEFVDVMWGVPCVFETDETGVITGSENKLGEDGTAVAIALPEVPIVPGAEAFCDYNWLIHNLRLPTAANTGFWAVTKQEMPVPGGEYTQFIIRLCKDRDGIGGEVVGQRATSVTTHVLYVLDSGTNVNDVKTELAKVTPSGKTFTDADSELQEPYDVEGIDAPAKDDFVNDIHVGA